MRILAVCSTIDFKNFVRRVTLEEIWRQHSETDFLFYTGLKSSRKKKKTIAGPHFYSYHFWVPETYKRFKIFSNLEHKLRRKKWQTFFEQYDIIFLMDPNQYYLLEYVNNQKVVYLLRDPNILLSKKNFFKEKRVLEDSDLILAISENLGGYYLDNYYSKVKVNVKLWSNSVDLSLWNYKLLADKVKENQKPVVGLGGNLTFVNDLQLLDYITKRRPMYEFRIAGGVNLSDEKLRTLKLILERSNVKHLGRIPLEEFPTEVVNWTIGIVAADRQHEYSRYLNNNKQYQYLALGKPFVTYNHDAEYSNFGDMVFVAENEDDYLKKIDDAIERSKKSDCVAKGKDIAETHSSAKRAQDFLIHCRNLL